MNFYFAEISENIGSNILTFQEVAWRPICKYAHMTHTIESAGILEKNSYPTQTNHLPPDTNPFNKNIRY